MRTTTLAFLALAGCATAKAPPPSAVATTAPPPPAPPTLPHNSVTDRADALREAAALLDKAWTAKDRGNRSYAEQLFSSAELIVGPEALAAVAMVFREGAPPRMQTPLEQMPMTTPPQKEHAVGDSGSEEPPEPKPKKGVLRGQLKVDGQPAATAVVTLEPADGRYRHRAPRHAVMEQRNREFAPHVLAVPTGSTVTFPNFDTVYHNVFSRSEAEPFDLGIYRSGQARDVTFDKDGVVRLGCNLHRNMSAWVVVVSQPHFAVVDAQGKFRFRNLDPGRYKVRVWSESGEPAVKDVVVAPDDNTIALDVHARPAEPDVDKFGVARGGGK